MYKVYLPKAYLKFPDGYKIELYSVGVIADVVGKDWREIRAWEIRGLIPLSPLSDKFGRRLYSSEMIRAVARTMEEYKLPKNNKGFARMKFSMFFKTLAIRLERIYNLTLARLQVKMPDDYVEHNNKYLRKVVVNSQFYKDYLKKKEENRIEAIKKISIARKRYIAEHGYTERQLRFFAACRGRNREVGTRS